MPSASIDGSRTGQLVAYAAAALLVVVGGIALLGGGGPGPQGARRVGLDGAAGAAAGGMGSAGRPGPPGGPLYVHVAGAVRRPGVYRVPGGSRVATAVRRAGGLTRRADLTAVNLALPLRDAQQVIVPRRGESGAVAAGGGASPAGSPATATGAGGAGSGRGKQISLASATPAQLDTLEGIGPKLAAAIIAYRDRHHGFKSVDELREVEGIGEKRFAAIRGAVRP